MRIVLDTNIVVRAVIGPQGPAGELLDRIRSPHMLIVSPDMLAEVYDVLTRDHITSLHGLTQGEVREFVQRLEAASLVVAFPQESVPVVVPTDRDDDVVIATAVAGRADVICTLDRHLHRQQVCDYCAERGIRILKDDELLRELRTEKN